MKEALWKSWPQISSFFSEHKLRNIYLADFQNSSNKKKGQLQVLMQHLDFMSHNNEFGGKWKTFLSSSAELVFIIKFRISTNPPSESIQIYYKEKVPYYRITIL